MTLILPSPTFADPNAMDATIPEVSGKGSSEILDGTEALATSDVASNAVERSIDATMIIDGDKDVTPSTTHAYEGTQIYNQPTALSTAQGSSAESDDVPNHDSIEDAVDHFAFRAPAASEAGSYDISVDSNVRLSVHA